MFKIIFGLLVMGLTQGAVLAGSKAEFLGASTVSLENPHDVKLSPDGARLYVSDVGNNRVVILNPDSLEMIGQFGADEQAGTHDVDIGHDGSLYVADTHNNRVLIYRESGSNFAVTGELTEKIRGPEGVLVHPNGRIYVAGAWSNNTVAYEDGKVVAELGGLASPHDLELTSDGNIWLADAGHDRMLLLSPDLEVLDELKGEPYNFDGVRYQDVLPDDTLIAADKYTHSIKIISAQGDLLLVLGDGNPGMGPGKFRTPEGVETLGDIVWFADSGNNRIVKYRLTLD